MWGRSGTGRGVGPGSWTRRSTGATGFRSSRGFIYAPRDVAVVPAAWETPPAYRRRNPPRPAPVTEEEHPRSHAAIPVAVAVALVGLYLGRYTVLAPGALGLLLLVSGVSLLSSRLNPLSPHFYLTRKPSWSAIGVVFLGALGLLADAYVLWSARLGPVLPRL